MTADVLLVTSWNTPCGIADYSAELLAALTSIDYPVGQIEVESDLHPRAVLSRADLPPVLHLNYGAAIHSQWHPSHVLEVRRRGTRVIVTYHDSGVPSTDQCKALHAVADTFIIHEPVEDLPGAIYWRQGIPPPQPPIKLDLPGRVLGTVGFPFPWKLYPEIASMTASIGWSFLVIAANATDAQVNDWRIRNPRTLVIRTFPSNEEVVGLLSGCDATIFCYACENAATSGAIREGIAARRPVIAFSWCRMMRDLRMDPVGQRAIRWCEDLQGAANILIDLPHRDNPDLGVVRLAEQDSWSGLAQKYAALYRGDR